MALFTQYTSNPTSLVNALLTDNSIIVDNASIVLNSSGPEAVNFYDGSLNLGIGAGLLLTSGHAPGTVNDVGWDGIDNSAFTGFDNGDADINAVVNTVFQTQSFDATSLQFTFSATDPAATSVSFDVVFGSEEYPEWVDAFVDCAVVMVNGVNYALFNHDPAHPLSVVSSNLAAGYFQDNADGHLNIQYDGVSNVLKIVAPIKPGQSNTIKIAIADTGDHIYDSGIFIANLTAGNTPGSGVVSSTTGDDTANTITGSIKDELIDLKGGDDIAYAGGGDDIVVGGVGNDAVYAGSGNDVVEGDAGNDILDGGDGNDKAMYMGKSTDYTVTAAFNPVTNAYSYTVTDTKNGEGSDTLTGVEQAQFSDGLYDFVNGQMVAHSNVVVPPSNTPGNVAISGKAMSGQTLTAIVTDPDGFAPAGVTYLWQSSADGITWTDIGTAQTYLVSAADVGLQIQVSASYTDNLSGSEAPVSAAVSIAQATTKLTITPMTITAPTGTSVMDPMTTLIQNAVNLGYTPNEASQAVKSAFGVAATVNLATYDAYAVLTKNPADTAALTYLKLEGQIAMTASVSDPTGVNLTLAALNAAASGVKLDLTTTASITSAGLDAAAMAMVQGLNKDMRDANSFTKAQQVWNDWAGKQDQLKPFQNHMDVISIHINQAPTGSPTSVLPDALLNTSYVVWESELLAGFTDPENDILSIAGITTDMGDLFVNNGDGSWTLFPPADYVGPLEVSYTVSDGKGGIAGASTMIVVQSTLAPVLTLDQPTAISYLDTVADDTFAGVSGSLTVSNAGGTLSYGVDGGTVANGIASLVGYFGTLEVDTATGAYTFTPNDVTLEGCKFDTVESYLITVTDGSTASSAWLDVNLTAADDPTLFSGDVSGTIIKDSTVTTGGTLTATDRDYDDAFLYDQINTQGLYGTFSIGFDGVWSYVLDSNAPLVLALAAGSSLTDTFTVQTAGGVTQDIVVTINGPGALTLDTPPAATYTDTAADDSFGETSGTLTGSGSGALTYGISGGTVTAGVSTLAGIYGMLSVDIATGAYTFTPSDAAIEGLKTAANENYTVTVSDGVTTANATFTVNLTGADDPTAFGGDTTGTTTEDGTLTTGGILTATDRDTGDAAITAQTNSSGSYGSFTIGADGVWSYALNNAAAAVQGLKAGQTVSDTFTVATAGGASRNVAITVTGANDAPTLTAPAAATYTDTAADDIFSSATGALSAGDVDGDTLTYGINGGTVTAGISSKVGTYGTLSVNTATGAYTFTPNDAAIEGLKTAAAENFTVTTSDTLATTTASFTVNLTGANDPTLFGGTVTGTVAEDGALTAGGTLTAADRDTGDAVITPQTNTAGTYGSFSVGANGVWSYTLNNGAANVQGLKAGQSVTDTFSVATAGGASQNITVTVNGANDAPTLGTPPAAAYLDTVANDAFTAAAGVLSAGDVDGNTLTYGISGGTVTAGVATLAGTYCTLSVTTATGAYTYAPNNAAIQGLKAAAGETFTVTVSDGTVTTTATFAVNLTGANDPTIFAGATTGAVTENATLTAGGTLTVVDRDTGDAVITAQTGTAGVYGSFSIGVNGIWSYTLNNAAANVQALAPGQVVTDTFAVATAGGTSQNIQITVTGAASAGNVVGTANADILNGTAGADVISGLAGNDTLNGLAGDDTLDGGLGDDGMVGGDGNDTYFVDSAWDVVTETNAVAATGGIDTVQVNIAAAAGTYIVGGNVENALLTNAVAYNLTGNALNNVLTGNAAANIITGAGGTDTMDGGDGADLYVIALAADHTATEIIKDTGLTGVDEIRFTSTAAGTLTLSAAVSGIETVTMGTGIAAAPVTTATTALNVSAAALTSGVTIIGNAGINTITGSNFNDIIDGGVGADKMTGGDGNDTFYVDNAADTVTEANAAAAGGIDLVYASVTHTLGANVENLILTGTAAINGTGNASVNIITGNSGVNVIDGKAGIDILNGGEGADIYLVGLGTDHPAAEVADTGITAGVIDEVRFAATAADTLTLYAGDTGLERVVIGTGTAAAAVTTGTVALNVNAALVANALTITGNAGANILTGTAYDDVITGGAGADTMDGGNGSDLYVIALTGDHAAAEIIKDTGAAGTDEIRFVSTAASTLTLTATVTGIEKVTIGTGTAAAPVTTATTALNVSAAALTSGITLIGNAGVNTLTGSAFNDIIDGGAGADKLAGGDGSDIYYVDNATDTVTEANAAVAGGIDQVYSSVTFMLGVNVENLALTGTAAINGTGNVSNNTLLGNTGANILDGKAGTDILNGGEGGDIYLIGVAADHPAAEIADSGLTGVDEVRFAATAAGTLTLYAGDTGIETVTIGTGTAAAAVTTATTALNVNAALVNSGLTITGNAGINILTGTAFNDILSGGKGADTLTGGTGRDTFLLAAGDSGQATNFDKITDYTKGAVGTGDLIDFTSNLTIAGVATAATATQASINLTTGVATFAAGSGTTITDALADIAASFTAATNAAGEFALFKVNNAGDYYLYVSDGTAGVTVNDTVVQLTGVTALSQLDLTAGNLTIVA